VEAESRLLSDVETDEASQDREAFLFERRW
jgi:hypothetical protein